MASEDRNSELTLEHILARIAVVDGWWQSEERLADDDWTPEKDYRYRTLFDNRDHYLGGVSYEKARVGYRIGRLAARNPRYEDRSFESVEEDVRAGWPDRSYQAVRPFVKLGFERARFSRALERTRRKVDELESAKMVRDASTTTGGTTEGGGGRGGPDDGEAANGAMTLPDDATELPADGLIVPDDGDGLDATAATH